MLTIDPRFMSVIDWTAKMGFALGSYGVVPKLLSADDWRGWANYIINLPDIAALDPPRPEPFTAWERWAERFNQSISSLTN